MDIKRLNPTSWFRTEEDHNRNLLARQARAYRPLDALHHDIDRMFDGVFRGFGLPSLSMSSVSDAENALLRPNVDVASNDEEYTVTVEIPGVEEKDVRLELSTDGTLSIWGEKKQEIEHRDKHFHRVERSYGSFLRSLTLPEDVNEDAISAKFKNGILTVTLPRKALSQASAKRIEIKSGT